MGLILRLWVVVHAGLGENGPPASVPCHVSPAASLALLRGEMPLCVSEASLRCYFEWRLRRAHTGLDSTRVAVTSSPLHSVPPSLPVQKVPSSTPLPLSSHSAADMCYCGVHLFRQGLWSLCWRQNFPSARTSRTSDVELQYRGFCLGKWQPGSSVHPRFVLSTFGDPSHFIRGLCIVLDGGGVHLLR